MSKKAGAPASAPNPAMPALVVFGLDEKGKAHASWFEADEVALATKAAGLMDMFTLAVATDEHRAVATSLPRGRVFASGRAFVPFAKTALYERLKGFGGHKPEPAVVEEVQDAEPPHLPRTWTEIRPGSLILAPEHDDLSWWPAIVQDGGEGHRLSLKWRDFADEDAFARDLNQLGLFHPAGTVTPADSPLDEQEIGDAVAVAFDTQRLPVWADVVVGRVVLATDGPGRGWFVAVVTEVKDDLYVLRWRDRADEAAFVRRREHLILYPAIAAPVGGEP